MQLFRSPLAGPGGGKQSYATWEAPPFRHRGAVALALAEIFGWSDVRMALRYTHATAESKRRAVENLAKPIGPSDESVTNEKGRVAALP
jgi:hypothetical protein